MDVIEIDPEVTQLARKYFRLTDSPNISIHDEDARIFLNRTNKKYDVIYGDAFKAQSPPYNLTTKEVVKKYYDSLNNDGVMLVNIIASVEGSRGKFLRAEYATFKSFFPHVYIFLVNKPNDGKVVQNIMLVAVKNKKELKLESQDPEINSYLSNIWKGKIEENTPILTDDFAPVEQYNLGLVF